MIDTLAWLLSWLMRPCYALTRNYPLAILLFTILTRIIILPVNIWVQKNGIKLVKMMPEINRLKIDRYGDRDAIADGQSAIWKREHYSPFADLLPLAVQLILLAGVIGVVREPALSGMTRSDLLCLGIDFWPTAAQAGGWYLLFPLLAGLAALVMCITQNRGQVLQAEQSRLNKYGLTILSVAISLYLGLYVRVGVAFYWICGNLLAIAQMYLLNRMYDPKKYVDYQALEQTRRELAAMDSIGGKRSSALRRRERADYRRFFSVANKHLVFYSEKSGFYKYFSGVIDYLLQHSNVTIHYITNDPDDGIFALAQTQPRIRPYYIGEKRLITLMMKMDADVVCMTTPDLQTYHIKRSLVRSDVEYVYIDHGVSSVNMLLREGALDHFDTVFCSGPHIVQEIRAREQQAGLPEKTLVPYGYDLLQEMTQAYAALPPLNDGRTRVLIGPSHQPDNILDSCLDSLMEQFLSRGYLVTIRPHPQYIRRSPARMEQLRQKWAQVPDVTLEEDFSGNLSILRADLMVSDWSNVAMEYAFSTKKPVLYIGTPMKIVNPNYASLPVEPIDLTLRHEIGVEVPLSQIDRAGEAAEQLLAEADAWADRITESLRKTVFTTTDSAAVGGRYLLKTLTAKK